MLDKNTLVNLYPSAERDEVTLQLVGDLLESDIFLAGLGRDAKNTGYSGQYPTIVDLHDFDYLVAGPADGNQDIREYVGFTDSFAEIASRFYFGMRASSSKERKRELRKLLRESDTKLTPLLLARIKYTLEKNGFTNAASLQLNGNENDIQNEYALVVNEIDAYISILITSAFYGGFDKWPFANQLYILFKTGGLPCGWLGPDPMTVDSEGASTYMQLLHFGASDGEVNT